MAHWGHTAHQAGDILHVTGKDNGHADVWQTLKGSADTLWLEDSSEAVDYSCTCFHLLPPQD